jgi:hypothetical protein
LLEVQPAFSVSTIEELSLAIAFDDTLAANEYDELGSL